MMLAILNSVPAVESVLSQGIRVNIRGTDRFHGVTPLMFASRIGAGVIVKLPEDAPVKLPVPTVKVSALSSHPINTLSEEPLSSTKPASFAGLPLVPRVPAADPLRAGMPWVG